MCVLAKILIPLLACLLKHSTGNEDQLTAWSFPDRTFSEPVGVMDVRAFGWWMSAHRHAYFPGFWGPDRSFWHDHRISAGYPAPKLPSLGCFFVCDTNGIIGWSDLRGAFRLATNLWGPFWDDPLHPMTPHKNDTLQPAEVRTHAHHAPLCQCPLFPNKPRQRLSDATTHVH